MSFLTFVCHFTILQKFLFFSIKRTQFSYSVEKNLPAAAHISVSGFISDSEIAFNKVGKITLCGVFSLSQTPFES